MVCMHMSSEQQLAEAVEDAFQQGKAVTPFISEIELKAMNKRDDGSEVVPWRVLKAAHETAGMWLQSGVGDYNPRM